MVSRAYWHLLPDDLLFKPTLLLMVGAGTTAFSVDVGALPNGIPSRYPGAENQSDYPTSFATVSAKETFVARVAKEREWARPISDLPILFSLCEQVSSTVYEAEWYRSHQKANAQCCYGVFYFVSWARKHCLRCPLETCSYLLPARELQPSALVYCLLP